MVDAACVKSDNVARLAKGAGGYSGAFHSVAALKTWGWGSLREGIWCGEPNSLHIQELIRVVNRPTKQHEPVFFDELRRGRLFFFQRIACVG